MLLLNLSACDINEPVIESPDIIQTGTKEPENITPESDLVIPPDEDETSAESVTHEIDLSPLELIGYTISDTGDILVGNDWGEELDIDVYRKYFFGTWEGSHRNFIIDDSQKRNMKGWWLMGGFYQVNENVVAFIDHYQVEAYIYWIDINYPKIMYHLTAAYLEENNYELFNVNLVSFTQLPYLTKTNAPINKPVNGYLSPLRLREISKNYGIPLEMLACIDEYGDYMLFLDMTYYSNYPIFIVSENENKLVLKSTVGNPFAFPYEDIEEIIIDVEYTIEKIDGEWVRTIEIDEEELKRLLEQ